MSGRKQHHIPQFLLRKFATRRSGGRVQVTVYSRERGIFDTPTNGIAAQRDFYSKPSDVDASHSLDGKITELEPRLAMILDRFSTSTFNRPLNAEEAAEFVTHLSVRNAHLRKVFGSAIRHIAQKATQNFETVDRARHFLGLDATTPSGPILDELERAWSEHGVQLAILGVSKESFYEIVFELAKNRFSNTFKIQRAVINLLFDRIRHEADSLIHKTHNNILNTALVPEAWVKVLHQFKWRIEIGKGFVLPDCVAIGIDENSEHQPLVLGVKDKVSTVFMPIAIDRMLIGEKHGFLKVPSTINEHLAACSWEFFVGAQRTLELKGLIPKVGTSVQKIIEDAIAQS